MSKRRYEIAVIGCGKIWETGHWKGLQSIPDAARVRYVYDTNEDLARKAADETGATFVDDPRRIFADDEVDIVAICTPPFARVEYVAGACESGKHLMLEKPMARTVEEALAICRSVREGGVKCFIPFSRALSRRSRAVADRVRAGEFGEPRGFVHASLGTPYSWVPLDHWMHDQTRSGGPVFDYSIHFIELARVCLGEAGSVLYGGAATTGRVKSDDHASLLVQYTNGAFGEFTKTWSFPPGVRYGHNTAHIVCRDAVIVMGQTVEVHTPEGASELEVPTGGPDGRAGSYLNLIAAIERGEALHADEIDGLRMNEILDAMERSRESGAREEVVLNKDV